MKPQINIKIYTLLLYFFISVSSYSQIQMPPMFSDNMILQQQSEVSIWGKGKVGKNIKIKTSWNNAEYETQVDASGNWITKIKTPAYGGPYEITITEKKELKLRNVMIGEVWMCSGQSNMEMTLDDWIKIDNHKAEIAGANYPNIRLLKVEKATGTAPTSNINIRGNGWQVCSPATVSDFSAVAYFFGRNLHTNLNIPIGLINSSWGGTSIEAWTSGESLKMTPNFSEAIAEISLPIDEAERNAFIEGKQEAWNQELIRKDFGLENNKPVAALIDYNDNNWNKMSIPGLWEGSKLPGFDGIVWFRKTIEIPASWHGKDLILSLGKVDDNETTYFNGLQIGSTSGFMTPREYTIPTRLVKKGKAVITVRVHDGGGEGGFHGEKENVFIALANQTERIELAGDWKYKVAVDINNDITPLPLYYTNNPNNPTVLYNAMIHPFTNYKIKGAIWYQGENNEARAYQYRTLLPLMINDWRTKWGYNFPFYLVQLPNFKAIEKEPGESDWAELREAQAMALHMDNTGMAVTIDVGNPADVHPTNKQDVGYRLSLVARAQAYGEKIPYAGPMYQSHTIMGNKIKVSFKHIENGLTIKDGTILKGFSVAGPDRKYYWADAVIENNEVFVSSPHVPFPIAVRYAWAGSPVCNLYNTANLPATPFRTDDWPGITFDKR
ncbi:sialate O-acetylesterase [Bacteroides sp. 519]|uniref:sialate O-acetylesterase n=1 Tax=Bacteroides sp. 519 TaxID=2302937 RepID=UPI0013D3E7D5|nr:sialate O-acetylesterase [Bacteroides sp. 519]NDV58037.1 9-O-acetylesterase [Bacteroides sp. 519]